MINWFKKFFKKEDNLDIDNYNDFDELSDKDMQEISRFVESLSKEELNELAVKEIQRMISDLGKCNNSEELEERTLEIINAISSLVASDNTIAILQFMVGKDDNIKLLYMYNIMDKECCNKFAEFMFKLNNGMYQEDIAALLMQNAEKTPEDKKFIQNVFKKWGKLMKSEDGSPAISPLDFN